MPTVLEEGPYRFFFYSSDQMEPQHEHVARDNRVSKFWLRPVRLQRSGGLTQAEIRRIRRIIEANHILLVEAWNEYFND